MYISPNFYSVERKRIVLEKAQKDRVKAELSAIRQAQDRERKEKARQRFRYVFLLSNICHFC